MYSVTQGLQYCTKHNEKYTRTMRDHFLLQYTIYWKDNSLASQHFKWILPTVELTAIAMGDGYEIITVVQYTVGLILCSYDLILHFYVYLLFLI